MSLETVSVKAHDIGVLFSDTLTATGFDFSGSTVKFLLKNVTAGTVISKTAVLDTGVVGSATVHYTTVATDLDVSGTYSQEWEITKGGNVLSFPSTGYNKVVILADLNNA
jgi:hypothetical protein